MTWTPEFVGDLCERQKWKFAKTMPWCPHFYTLKDTWDDPVLYRDVVAWILENGHLRIWGKQKPKMYFDWNEWRYWPMTTEPDESILFNRMLIVKDKSKAYTPVSSEQQELPLTDEVAAADKSGPSL